jgi:hypothetical protein
VVHDQLDILEGLDFDPRRFISIHAQAEADFELNLEIAHRGVWIEYDGIGWGDDDAMYIRRITAMLEAGFGAQIMLSMDRGWYDPVKPGGENIAVHVPERVLPAQTARCRRGRSHHPDADGRQPIPSICQIIQMFFIELIWRRSQNQLYKLKGFMSTLLALTALLLWSTLALLGSRLVHLPPFLLLGVALGLSGLISLARPRAWHVSLPTLAVGIGGIFGYHFLYFRAFALAPAVEANLINYLWSLRSCFPLILQKWLRAQYHWRTGAVRCSIDCQRRAVQPAKL